jgi:hypothetical protein
VPYACRDECCINLRFVFLRQLRFLVDRLIIRDFDGRAPSQVANAPTEQHQSRCDSTAGDYDASPSRFRSGRKLSLNPLDRGSTYTMGPGRLSDADTRGQGGLADIAKSYAVDISMISRLQA